MITNRIDWTEDTVIYPGEDKLEALNKGALRVLTGQEYAKTYPSIHKREEHANNGKGI
ncbi:hypothetical protein [Lentibacillus amyloliquefaciens]|uniref:hypothetical protein n=1 Tax=Lentibacillus amyloliquefaciens TaxID=1472767 RepID=UPI0012E383F8|nr:hypothetical protein [Lentibacillus amyloliquefaciens]